MVRRAETLRDSDSGGNKSGDTHAPDGLVDLPLRSGSEGPKDLEFDPLGGEADAGRSSDVPGRPVVGAGNAGQRPEPRPGISNKRLVILVLGALVAVALVWWFFPDPPRAEFSVTRMDFGTARVGQSTEEKSVSVTNRGQRKLRIETLGFTPSVGEHYQIAVDGCAGQRLPSEATCEVRLVFRPLEPGDQSGRLVLESNDRTGPAVALAAVAVAPELGLAPSAASFGAVALESEAQSREVTLSNVGSATLEFRRIRIEGPAAKDFSRSRRCPSSRLEPGEACSFEIRFEPSVSGPRNANLVVDSDALDSPGLLPLAGIGLWEGPPLDPISAVLDLGEQRVGERSAPKSLVFVNRTGGPVSVDKTAVSQSSSFAVVEDRCRGRVVASGESCSVAVTFLPVEDGGERAVLSLAASGASEDAEVDLRGQGVTPRLEAEVRAVDFTDQRVGFESAPRSVGFRNTGTATLLPRASSMAGPNGSEFLVRSDECVGKPLIPGKKCLVGIGFNPARSGARRASLSFDPGFELEEIHIALTGVGVVSALRAAPARLDFGKVYLGRVEGLVLTLVNEGTAQLEIGGLRFDGSEAGSFGLGQMTCALDSGLGAAASCGLEIDFEPEVARTYRAHLVVDYNGPDSPARVELFGEGKTPAPAFRISTDSLDLGSVPVGGRGEIGTVAISNPGAAWLPIKSISLRGDNAEDFQLVAGTCDGVTALAPSGSCTVGVRLTPGTSGSRRATILVRHGAGSGSATVTLIGRGFQANGS